MTLPQKATWHFFKKLLQKHLNPSVVCVYPEIIDEAYFFRLLNEHRVELTLQPLLKSIAIPNHSLLEKLQKRCQSLVYKEALQQQKALFSMIDIFAQHHIPCVVLKGLPLNQQLYGDQAVRRSADIDILIDQTHLLLANTCLNKIGFYSGKNRHGVSNIEFFQALPARYQKYLKDLPYWDKAKAIHLELHFKARDAEVSKMLTERALTTMRIKGHAVQVMRAEENFLFLCWHGSKHHWMRLQWLIDLGIFYQKIPLDWDLLWSLAKKQDGMRAVLEAKQLLQKEFGIILPAFSGKVMDKLSLWLRRGFVLRQWSDYPENQNRLLWRLKTQVRRYYMAFFAYETWKEKMDYCCVKWFVRQLH